MNATLPSALLVDKTGAWKAVPYTSENYYLIEFNDDAAPGTHAGVVVQNPNNHHYCIYNFNVIGKELH